MVLQLKKAYETKCIELNNAEENLKTALNSVTTKRMEQDKVGTINMMASLDSFPLLRFKSWNYHFGEKVF